MWEARRRFGPLDALLLVMVAAFLVLVLYRVTMGLQYTWNWRLIPQFLVRFDAGQERWVANYLLQGLFTTIRLSCWAGVFALLLGLIMALARISPDFFCQSIARIYVATIRNLPPLIILFIVYFFLADQVPVFRFADRLAVSAGPAGQRLVTLLMARPGELSPFLAATLSLAVFEGAYMTEIIRSSIEAVPREQWEAAHALGMTRSQCLRHIILPQALPQILPPLAGQSVSLIKDSAIVSIISVQELSYQGTQLMASTYLTIEVWITVSMLYLALTLPTSFLVRRLEARFS